jgi:hypothetical protein
MGKESADRQILDFAVRLDNNDAIKAVSEMSKGITALTKKKFDFGKNFGSKELEAFQKTIKHSTQDTEALRDALSDAGKFSRKAAEQGSALAKRFDAAKKAAQQLNKVTSAHRKNIRSAEKQGKSGADMDALQKTAQSDMKKARAEVLRANRELTKATHEQGVPKTLAKHKSNQERVKNFAETWDWAKTGEDIGGGITDVLSSMRAKDLGGIAKGVSSMVGGSFKAVAQKATHWAAAKNTDSMAAGKGPAGGAAGGILQMANKMSGLVGTLAKLGPILGMATAFFAGLIKLVVDAEAMAKKFNKDILESASSAEFLADNMGDSGRAGKALGATLKSIRSSAFDWQENNSWGISAEDHKRTLNTLTSEGVSLRDLETQFKNTKQASVDTGKEMANFADVTHMSIAYSRLFGVSLDQITQFQAEMMTELGQSLNDTQLQFSRMTKAATESGMAANKFFGILRSVSADLSLYHTRLEDVVSTLKTLGRVMSPKNAQKYLQLATQGLKNMGEADRLRLTLLADKDQAGYSKGVLQEDIKDKSADLLSKLSKQINGSVDEAKTLLDGGTIMRDGGAKNLDQLVKDAGQYREAKTEMDMDQKELESGGQMGVGVAAANASLGAQFDLKARALKKFGGANKLKDMAGVKGYAARQVTGVSQEEFRSMAKMEQGIDAQRELMKKDHNLFKKSGIKVVDKNGKEVPEPNDAQIDAAIDAASTNRILQSMTDTDQEALLNATEQKNFAKETSEYTHSMLEKLDNIFDALFNFIYDAVEDLLVGFNKLLSSLPSWLKGDTAKVDPEVEKKEALKKKLRRESRGSADSRRILKGLEGSEGSQGLASEFGPQLMKKWGAMDDSIKSSEAEIEKSKKVIADNVSSSETKGKAAENIKAEEAKIAEIKKKKLEDFTLLRSGTDSAGYDKSRADAGADASGGATSPEQMSKIMGQMLWNSKAGQLATNLPKLLQSAPAAPEASQSAIPGGSAPVISSAPVSTSSASPATSKAVVATASATQDTATNTAATAGALQSGVPLAPQTMTDMGKSILDAVRQALFEYYMYKDIKPQDMMAKIGGKDGTGFTASGTIQDARSRLKANADGGLVTSIGSDGMAVVSPAAGEGLASIGKGETIVPAGGGKGGGGGDNIQLNFNGSYTNGMKEMLRREVPKLILEYKKREKYT